MANDTAHCIEMYAHHIFVVECVQFVAPYGRRDRVCFTKNDGINNDKTLTEAMKISRKLLLALLLTIVFVFALFFFSPFVWIHPRQMHRQWSQTKNYNCLWAHLNFKFRISWNIFFSCTIKHISIKIKQLLPLFMNCKRKFWPLNAIGLCYLYYHCTVLAH